MDEDLQRAVRRVAAAILHPDRRWEVLPPASDAEVRDAVTETAEIMTDKSAESELVALAFALYLLWPRSEVDGFALVDVVERALSQIRGPRSERKTAYAAVQAVLSERERVLKPSTVMGNDTGGSQGDVPAILARLPR